MLSKSAKLCIVLYGAAGVAFLIWLFTRDPFPPQWKVGDCVQVSYPRERWEPEAPVRRIAELGKNAYRAEDDDTIPYSFQNIYQKVACPEASHVQ